MTYESAKAQLTGRNAERRKIAHVTYLERRGENIAVKQHATDVLTYLPNGDCRIDVGQWQTVTTKLRLNNFGPNIRVCANRGIWYVYVDGTEYPFANGMVIHADRTVSGAGEDPKAKLKLKRQVAKYCEKYMKALAEGNVSAPGLGDCFYCQMREVKTNQTWGEISFQDDHMMMHMEESYFVPSILARAIELFPVSQAAKWYLGSFWDDSVDAQVRDSARRAGEMCKDQLHKALRRFVTRQLGMAA